MNSDSPYNPPRADLSPVGASSDLSAAQVAGRIPPHARPLLLAAVWLLVVLPWLVYDGWFNSDAEMQQHQTFNRVGSIVVVVSASALYFVSRIIKVAVEARESRPSAQLYVSPEGDVIKVATIPWLWSLIFGGLNLIPHGRPVLGVIWFIGSQLTVGLGALALPLFVNRLIWGSYEARGWRLLRSDEAS